MKTEILDFEASNFPKCKCLKLIANSSVECFQLGELVGKCREHKIFIEIEESEDSLSIYVPLELFPYNL